MSVQILETNGKPAFAVLPYAEFGVKKTVLGCTKPGST